MVFKPVFLILTLCLLAGCSPEREAKTPQRILSLSTAATHILTELEVPPCAIDEYGRIAAGSPPPAVIGKGAAVSREKIAELVRTNFDLRPGGIIEMLDLRRPIYEKTAAYGHFGRTDLDLSWEKTDKAEALKKYL